MRQILSVVLTTCLLISCNNNGTSPQYFDVQLTADDVGVTEAWLRLQIAPSVHHNALRLTRDGSSQLTVQYSGLDTVIFVNSLLPKHSYTFKAYTLADSVTGDSSNAFTVATLDTTSHDITWQIDTIGDGASSSLVDVAIISDTNVWAVGEIYLEDSTGNLNPNLYNLATCNGSTWLIRQAPYYFQGNAFYGQLRTVYASNASDIWLGSGNMIHWDGRSFNSVQLPPSVWGAYRINELWGSGKKLYLVGDSGSIAQYGGGTWQKLESGTTTDIDDIWGALEPKSAMFNILCAVSSPYSTGDTKILSIGPSGSISSLPWIPPHRINTVWFKTLKKIFVGGGGLYVGTDNVWKEVLDLPPYFSTRIRGTAINDVFVVGSFGLCGHFNGMTWRNYPEAALPEGEYEGLSVSTHMVIAVGFSGGQAVVLRGYRR